MDMEIVWIFYLYKMLLWSFVYSFFVDTFLFILDILLDLTDFLMNFTGFSI